MGFFNFFKKNKIASNKIQNNQHSLEKETLDDAQQEFIDNSISNAERIVRAFNDNYNGAFDYSEESLATLDELLDNIIDFGEQMDDSMKNDLIAQAGSYIFEVARRNFGGKYFWLEHLNQPILVTGLPNFEISIVAFEKVKMRLENGIEDNIPYFFKGYSERVRNAKFGDKAMLV
jgi:hypothetical protein